MQRAIDRLEPFQRAISKAHLAAAGVSVDALEKKPLIAIANSWNEICPGHEPLKKLAEEVKKGILEAGGEPVEFNTIAMCDGIAQGHSGMRYCLPHREIVTDSIEAMVVGEGVFDGVVYMASCDKIIPAMLNAAARIDLPSVIVTAGPCFAQIKPNESKELRQRFLRGEITERQLIEGTLKYYTGPGVCPFLGTANTMGALCESLGMMLPGSSLIPSSTSMRRFSARESGSTVMKLVEQQIRPSQIITKEALENTVTLLSAIGGSLNAMIHLPALAAELGLELDWDDINTGALRNRPKWESDSCRSSLCRRNTSCYEGTAGQTSRGVPECVRPVLRRDSGADQGRRQNRDPYGRRTLGKGKWNPGFIWKSGASGSFGKNIGCA